MAEKNRVTVVWKDRGMAPLPFGSASASADGTVYENVELYIATGTTSVTHDIESGGRYLIVNLSEIGAVLVEDLSSPAEEPTQPASPQ